MSRPSMPVRELIPERRISCAKIRELIAREPSLSRWSREAPNGIRPNRLALLVRRSIWRGHDVCYNILRERMRKAPGGKVAFDVEVEIHAGDTCRQLTSRTIFTCRPSGRITADIKLSIGDTDADGAPITHSCILLKPPARRP